MSRPAAVAAALLAGCLALPAVAENWFEYSRVGATLPTGTVWISQELDADSLARDGDLIRYRIRLKHPDKGPMNLTDMRADCGRRTRGKLSGDAMRPVQAGSAGAQELTTACALAGGRGLLR